MAIGWLSPNLLKLQSNDSPLLGGPMTLSETSWIGSYFSIGAILGNCIFGIVSNYIGRKNTLCILALPNLVNIFFRSFLIWSNGHFFFLFFFSFRKFAQRWMILKLLIIRFTREHKFKYLGNEPGMRCRTTWVYCVLCTLQCVHIV